MKAIIVMVFGFMLMAMTGKAQVFIPLYVSGNGSVVASSNNVNVNPVFGQNGIGVTTDSNNRVYLGLLAPYSVQTSYQLFDVPKSLLYQNYPNPFGSLTTIKFQIPEDGLVRIRVFDLLGAQKSIVTNRKYLAGEHDVKFLDGELRAGAYIFTMEFEDYRFSRTMIKMK